MDPQQWEKVKDLFELGEPMTPAEREDLLAKEPDEVVRKEAARLLKINPINAFIDQPVMSPEYLDRFTGHAALLAEGELLGARYKIERRIASGGMGDVYSAYDKDLRERIAIKTIRQDIISNAAIVSRFRREISLARRVAHPNVCKVYDLSQEKRSSDGRTVDFLTMELVEGETLSQWLKREAPVGFEVARPLLEQICAGLAAAHDAGVVHRDFKGSNVLIAKKPDGSLRAVVTDFGLARSVSQATGVSYESSTGLAGGTPAYMAPEQMEGRTVGPKADLYALGIVMYEMATGTAPHTGDSPLQIAVRRVTEKPQSPRRVNPDIDPSWEEAILRCLEYKPEDRPADARAVAELFGKDRPLFTVPRWRMPRWVLPALASVAAVALGAWWWANRAPEHSEEAMRWYRKGTDALMDGAYSTARASFEQALKLEPGFGVARARLADTFYELDLIDESKSEIAKANSSHAEEKEFIEVIRHALQYRYPQALQGINTLLGRKSTTERLLDKARILDRSGQTEEALNTFNAVLAKDPSLPGALLRRFSLLRAKGKLKEATDDLNKAESAYRGNPEGLASVLIERAKVQVKLDDSIRIVRDARGLAKSSASATMEVRSLFAEAYYLARSGEASQAEAIAAEALSLAKALGQAGVAAVGLRELAYIPYSKGDYKAAAVAYKAALDFAQATGALARAAEIQRSLGDALARGNQIDAGIAMIEQALQYHEATGQTVEAIVDRRYLADCDYMAGRHDKALKSQRELIELAQKTPGAEAVLHRIRLAILSPLYARSEFPEVIRIASAMLPYYQMTGETQKELIVRLHLGSSLRHLGRFAEARSMLAPLLTGSAKFFRDEALAQDAYLMRDEGNIDAAIQRAESEMKRVQGKLEPGNDFARTLCTLYSLTSAIDRAESYCRPLVLLTQESKGGFAELHAAFFRIHAGRKDWTQARVSAQKLLSWASTHNDPEMLLLAHLLLAVASAEGGSKAVAGDSLEAWRKARKDLEMRWSPADVNGMLKLPMFQKYKDLIGGFDGP